MLIKRTLILSALLALLPLASGHATEALSSHVYVELPDAPTIAVDWSKGDAQTVTLGGNRALTFSNGKRGGRYTLILKQDPTGTRTVTWPPSVRWPGESHQASTLTTSANKTDYITFFYNGVTYDAVGIAQSL